MNMNYNWVDYTSAHKEIVEPWIDEEAKRFTGCDEGFDAYYQYWANEQETELGRNFWAKLIIADMIPIGIMTIALWDGFFTISEFIIRPDMRGMGFGASVLAELLAESHEILGAVIKEANAVIYPNNIPSQKAFEKAGFVFHSEHPDGDAWNYQYHKSED